MGKNVRHTTWQHQQSSVYLKILISAIPECSVISCMSIYVFEGQYDSFLSFGLM